MPREYRLHPSPDDLHTTAAGRSPLHFTPHMIHVTHAEDIYVYYYIYVCVCSCHVSGAEENHFRHGDFDVKTHFQRPSTALGEIHVENRGETEPQPGYSVQHGTPLVFLGVFFWAVANCNKCIVYTNNTLPSTYLTFIPFLFSLSFLSFVLFKHHLSDSQLPWTLQRAAPQL